MPICQNLLNNFLCHFKNVKWTYSGPPCKNYIEYHLILHNCLFYSTVFWFYFRSHCPTPPFLFPAPIFWAKSHLQHPQITIQHKLSNLSSNWKVITIVRAQNPSSWVLGYPNIWRFPGGESSLGRFWGTFCALRATLSLWLLPSSTFSALYRNQSHYPPK